jgi:prophage regulatory protein
MTDRLMRYPEVVKATGLSRTTIWRRVAQGEFPKRVQISDGVVGFYQKDIEAFIKSRSLAEGVPDESK